MERNMLRKEKIRARDSLSAAEREALSGVSHAVSWIRRNIDRRKPF